MVAKALSLECQVVRVDADAMAADETRAERYKIPFGASCLEHRQCIYALQIENQGEFVHQSDVQVALSVLDHLGCFSGFYSRCDVNSGRDDCTINLGHQGGGFGGVSGDHLRDLLNCMFLVSRVDPFG